MKPDCVEKRRLVHLVRLSLIVTTFFTFYRSCLANFRECCTHIGDSSFIKIVSDPIVNKTPIEKKQSFLNRVERKKIKKTFYSNIVSTVGALAVVLFLFFGGVYSLRILSCNRFSDISGTIEIVDSCWVGKNQQLLVVKWGDTKLLLISRCVNTLSFLSEITDEEEMTKMLKLTQQSPTCAKIKILRGGQRFTSKSVRNWLPFQTQINFPSATPKNDRN